MNDRANRTSNETFDETIAMGSETARGVREGFTSALKNVRDLNVRLIDMAWSNTNAAFEFAREVAGAERPSDLAQAMSTHAVKQFRVLTRQASELAILGQRFTSTAAEPLVRRITRRSSA